MTPPRALAWSAWSGVMKTVATGTILSRCRSVNDPNTGLGSRVYDLGLGFRV